MLTSDHVAMWLLKFNRSNETLTEALGSLDDALDRAKSLIKQENTTLIELLSPNGKRLRGEEIHKVSKKSR